ncbi:MAG: DUF1801 domain-containing protein [Anaerolineales bacterium]|nr:DUF1801 domain-containing protein [Anaerolineales bacterium]MCB9143919.1 DUF1801 domain-containing protein [Anaerolineales bacterium]
MAELKTKKNTASVETFIKSIKDEQIQEDCREIIKMMKQATKAEPKMWGTSIVGFGEYHYKYASGREGDWFLTGFSPRKQNLTLYIMSGFDQYNELLKKLGKFSTGKSCLYIKKLENIDKKILKELIIKSVQHMSQLNKGDANQ